MDDATIEDEIDSNEQTFSPAGQVTHQSLLYQLLNQSWLVVLLCSLLTLCWVFWKRRNSWQGNDSPPVDSVDRYEHMERIRRRQQDEYEEQMRRRLEEKKARIESMKSAQEENASRTKYRSVDHNPLTGQSTKSDGGSCSWRPSARRKPAGG